MGIEIRNRLNGHFIGIRADTQSPDPEIEEYFQMYVVNKSSGSFVSKRTIQRAEIYEKRIVLKDLIKVFVRDKRTYCCIDLISWQETIKCVILSRKSEDFAT